ncbi:MAG TPA: hypothetical protein VL025_08455 [Thermoanaerobaculia bacterium]|nr:hypothetical protein [Thermoanaerobaculia bacterium]
MAERLLPGLGRHGPGLLHHLAEPLRHPQQLVQMLGSGRELRGMPGPLLPMELLLLRKMSLLLRMEGLALLMERHRPPKARDHLGKRRSRRHLPDPHQRKPARICRCRFNISLCCTGVPGCCSDVELHWNEIH